MVAVDAAARGPQDRAAPSAGRRTAASSLQKNFGVTLSQATVETVIAFDEGRFWLKTWLRRRCPYGERPPWFVDETYAWVWFYAAVEPTTGKLFCLLLQRSIACASRRFCKRSGQNWGSSLWV